jgi:hypothetical protein
MSFATAGSSPAALAVSGTSIMRYQSVFGYTTLVPSGFGPWADRSPLTAHRDLRLSFVAARNASQHSIDTATTKVVFPTLALNSFLMLALESVARSLAPKCNRFTQV